MSKFSAPRVVIVDHGLGNLYSVQQACAHVGLQASITADQREILSADAVILPGVGAFGDAMRTLHRLDLVSVLRDLAGSPKPLLGICLGVQLLMTESFEFGRHAGLGIIEGQVVSLERPQLDGRTLKVPQIGWNRVCPPAGSPPSSPDLWADTPLATVPKGAYMYFVHSYVVQPQDPGVILSTSRYGHIDFCSSLGRGNVFACQFHPERSGPHGLTLYRNLARRLTRPA